MAKQTTYLDKLKKIFANIDEDKQTVVMPLIENAAFMADELDKLMDHIKVNGWVEDYQNGANQFGKKKSSEGDTYQQMIKNFVAVIKQLKDFLPDGAKEVDEVMKFIQRR